mmetsp:Transcript_4718/g.13337  ORF Transcript_4718/g.13337 Transcript_4718/m.13337 type:complete len:750 (+) Transcript_4718:518-2767(+)
MTTTTTNMDEQLTMSEIPEGPFNPVPASKAPCEPNDSDVLCGRGGTINTHPGNAKYRQLVEQRKRVYLTARFKREKRLISESIIKEIRNQNPPGRFLNRDTKDGDWYDIGDIKAREKTSQALRENLPKLRKELEAEKEAEKEAAAAKKKEQQQQQKRAEEDKERAEQERLRQQQWAGGYSYGHQPHQPHQPHYSHHHPHPHPPHQNYHHQQAAPPSRSFSSGGSGSASGSGSFSGSGGSMYRHHHPHAPPPPPQHRHHHPHSGPAPAVAPAPPGAPNTGSHAYPYGLPPRNETKTESSVLNAVTSAFGFGPASSHPSAPPPPGSCHPGAPSNQQHGQQQRRQQDVHITTDDVDEVARLMLEDSPRPDGTAAAASVAEPIPSTSSNLAPMDDKSVASGMFSMAQHILFSWDNKSTATAKTSDKTKDDVAMGGSFDTKPAAAAAAAAVPSNSYTAVKNEGGGGVPPAPIPPAFRQQPFRSYRYEDEVSEEGQEVELLEMSSMDTEDMPPPPPQPQAASRRRISALRRPRGAQIMATRDHEARDPSTPPPPGGAARQNLPSNVFLDDAPHTPGGAHSLDDGNLTLEGMSICSGSVGTTLGGQSLVGVFDDHHSNENTSSAESASVSTGTRASSGKGFQQPQAPHSGGAGTGVLKTNQSMMMGPPLSPMVAPPRSRNGSETYSVGDHSLMSARSESKVSVASSYQRLGSLALSPSTESALNACAASTGGAPSIGGISFPDEDMMSDGPTIKLG